MKRILTLLALSMFCYQAQSQILFSQDFESGSIDPMTAIDVDGKTIHPNVSGVAGPTWKTAYSSTFGSVAVVSTSWFTPVGIADDWLISPAITVADSNTFLIWQAYTPDAAYRDGYQVRISTTNDSIQNFTNLALNVAAELTTVQQRSIKLDAYVGQTIYFAFRNNSNDKFLLYLDNIRVEKLKNVNVIARTLDFEKYNTVGTEVPIKVSLENHGANPINSLLFEYTVGGYPYVDTVTGLNIAPLRTFDLTHSLSLMVQDPGEFPITVNLLNPNNVDDEDPADNSISKNLYGMSKQLPKKVVVEEATGTWCIWCPRGAVNMDLIAAQHGDIAMLIAVHNFDPMVVPEYDDPFSATVGGYPSGHVDRKSVDIDPADFATALNGLRDRVVPIHVNTSTTWDPDTRLVSIKATAHSSIATMNNNFRFSCVLTEDNVTGSDPGYAQANIYSGGAQGPMGGYENLPDPVPANQMVYHFVARALLGGFEGMEGSIPDVLEADEQFEVQFDYQVPVMFDPDQMKALVFILDDETGEILNGDDAHVTDLTSTPLVPAGRFMLYPNPTSDMLHLEVDYETTARVTMKIYDTYGKLIRQLGTLDLTQGKQTEQIHVGDLANGNYILELRNENKVTALPFTKL